MNEDAAANILIRTLRSSTRDSILRKQSDRSFRGLFALQKSISITTKEDKAAIAVQRTFRSYSVRLYLQNEGIQLGVNNDIANAEERKLIALKKAQVDFNNKRIQERKMALCRHLDYDKIIQDRIKGHVDTLKKSKVKYESMMRKQNNSRQYQHRHNQYDNDEEKDTAESSNSLFLRRCDDRKLHLNEIVEIINDQIMFVQKLSAKSSALTKHGLAKLKENQEQWKSVQYAIDFAESKIELSPQTKRPAEINAFIEEERNKLHQSLVEYDFCQESFVDQECLRFEKELNMLALSSNVYHALSECIMDIETWEAERFGVQTTLLNGTKTITSADEAEMYFQLIDDNQAKLNSTRKKHLPKLYEEASDLYHSLLDTLERDVYFQCDSNGIITATLKASMTLPSTQNYCWSLLEWMEHFSQKLNSFHDDNAISSQEEQSMSEDRYKDTLQFAQSRREILTSKHSSKKVSERKEGDETSGLLEASSTTSSPNALRKLKWGLFGTSTGSGKIQRRTTGVVRELLNHNNIQIIHSELKRKQMMIPSVINKARKVDEDKELTLMKTVVKKTMNRQNGSRAIGVASLQFTVGKEETNNFSKQNENNESSGQRFYQNRIELGNHVEIILWVQMDSDSEDCITSITWAHKDNIQNLNSQEVVYHEKLNGALCIERDSNCPKIISSIQITYANSKEYELLGNDYELIPSRLSEFDFADAYLWVAHVDRTTKTSSTDLKRMKRELLEYEEMLSQNPDDYLLQELVKEMERRITLTQRKEKEQRGLDCDHIGYIKEFLALSDTELDGFKKVFLKICRDLDGTITINEFVAFLDEPQSLTSVLEGCITVTAGNIEDSKTINFGQFTKGIGILAMFSHSELMKCLFCAIDNEGLGFIPKHDFYSLLCFLHPEKDIGMASRSIRDVMVPEALSFDFFQSLTTRFPTLFFPMSRLQQSIRKKCLGMKWWNNKIRKFLHAKELVAKEKQIQTLDISCRK